MLRKETAFIIIIYLFVYLLHPKAAQHNITATNTEETHKKLNTKIRKKVETIKQITQQMKPWCMHQFTAVFSNDFQICSLISKSGVDGSGLEISYLAANEVILP